METDKEADLAYRKAKLALMGIGGSRQLTPTAAFFGHLAFRLIDQQAEALAMRVDGGTQVVPLPTAGTEGKHVWYNPKFWMSITEPERIGVLCHEIMHCALTHHLRLRYVDREKAQMACDLAINGMLLDAGFELPHAKDICIAGRDRFKKFPQGLAAEEYYGLLTDEFMESLPKGKGGIGSVFIPDQCEPGEGEEGDGDSFHGSEADWKMAVAEASQLARQRGTIPGQLGQMIDDLLATPKLDWRTIVAQFLVTHCKDEYSWNRPSRRAHLGVVLPQLWSERPGHLAVALDTSGSVSDDELKEFCVELQGIMACLPIKVSVIWCDAMVHRIDEWEPTDGEFPMKPVGRGGTDHRPVFAAIEEMEEPPVALICLTDMATCFPEVAPAYAVLWVSNSGIAEAPFGDVVQL